MKQIRFMSIFMITCLLSQLLSFNSFASTTDPVKLQQCMSNAIVLCVGNSTAYKFNEKVTIDTNAEVKPIISEGRTLVPVRFLADSLGAEISWDRLTKTVTMAYKGSTLLIPIGSKTITIDGATKEIDVPAKIIEGRTFLPLRSVAEAFKKQVFYNGGIIFITDDQNNYIDSNSSTNIVNEITQLYGVQPTTSTSKELTVKQIAEKETSVVIINAYDKTGTKESQGSGFYVAEGLFATNYHVIADGYTFKIITSNGNSLDVQGIVKVDPHRDLAIIKTRTIPENVVPVNLGTKLSVTKGDKIVTIGSPEGLQNTISEGIVSGFRSDLGCDLIQITAPITHGSSGGPLFNMQGEVIGINSLGSSEGNLNFAVTADYLFDWIKELKAQGYINIVTDTADALMPFDSSVNDNDLKNVIMNSFEAMTQKNIDKYMLYVSKNNEDRDKIKSDMQELFKEYDLVYTPSRIDVLYKMKDWSKLGYYYHIYKPGNPTDYLLVVGVCYLANEGGQWKVARTKEKVLDNDSTTNSGNIENQVTSPTPMPTAAPIPTANPINGIALNF